VVYDAITLFNRQMKTDIYPSINIYCGIYDVINVTSTKRLKATAPAGEGEGEGESYKHFKLNTSNNICIRHYIITSVSYKNSI
jgi:hypothetical protein